ncbi:assimilatory sulfite reductase (NADPH) flavoprotein subunit [Vibrio sp. SS-MA-C1-2]|uniref:assimilatory sulfite reductase (NADPH) flavoprotein subunit n=1 Tax=Vibrio sp. SS-MA-C1-2 TaxID=2908646 RepID=UPI001F2A73A7|nr:assimilatory sulfite reductase (NADPH) flavoprotein subunit [Vibrio sp. SS-MA-C1-2]UJF18000.1 assimilatory sulfite reductase (NADPH) flavoprotein subunit [Vibrio sp. SS-MA-C1-2]
MNKTELNAAITPLSTLQVDNLQQLINHSSTIELSWVSGYLAGITQDLSSKISTQQSTVSHSVAQAAFASNQPLRSEPLTIVYASQTGNAKGLATQILSQVEQKGLNGELINIADLKAKTLKKISQLLLIVSTHGEGEPPDSALSLFKLLKSRKAPNLDHLTFSVIGLGDSSYDYFCKAASDFSERFLALGATEGKPKIDADLDYVTSTKPWVATYLKQLEESIQVDALRQTQQTGDNSVENSVAGSLDEETVEANTASTVNGTVTATVIANQKITGRDSLRNTRHIELDLADSGLTYQPGDALGVWYKNDLQLIGRLTELLGLELDENVELTDPDSDEVTKTTLRDALSTKLDITRISIPLLKWWLAQGQSEKLTELIADKASLKAYLNHHQVIDLALEYPIHLNAQQLANALIPLKPRLYSIASSQSEVEDEVHLTVGLLENSHQGQDQQETRLGGASSYLCHQLVEDDQVDVFVEPNPYFRLPESDKNIIMIGAGTGIAPYRGFLQQRDAEQATGKNWLIFGNQTYTQDFLYQTEWQQYFNQGLLTDVDLAFSRDQQQKIYVQDKLAEQAEKLYQWLQSGAYIYLCGDAQTLGKSVDQQLINIAQTKGDLTSEQAEEWLDELRVNGRYQKDVY